MFDVQNVSLSYGERQILTNVSFKLEDGERAAIIGPNGTGKSTLLKIIAGKISPETGSISIPKNTEVGYLPQDIELNSDRSVLDECRQVFAEVLEHEKEMRLIEERMGVVDHESDEFAQMADRYEYLMHETQRRDIYTMDSTISRVLAGLGFRPKDIERPCNEFSGGWQMRIALAKLLLQNPETLLLDEPTNHLDIESIMWLADWIKGHEGAVLMVSHERFFMDALVTKVLELDRSNLIVYRGNYTESLVKRAERREHAQRAFDNQQREIEHIQKFIDRFRYQASKAALVQSRIKQLERIERVEAPVADQGTISFTFPPAPRSAKEVLVAEGITKAYGAAVILKDVDVTIYRGEKVALVGVNGAGKTTLMRILANRDPDYSGKITYGSNVSMQYFAQYDKEDLHPDNTVRAEFLSNAPLSVSEKARSILGAFLFSGDDVEKKVAMLSGGERTRLRLAKMLCGSANLLLMDEPTNHLDIGSRLTLEEALRQYDGAVLIVSHDRYFLDNVVNRVIEIADGKATSYPGNYADYLEFKALQGTTAPATVSPQLHTLKEVESRSKPVDAAALAAELRGVPKRESHEERRERQEREKKQRNRLRKLEGEVSQHEETIYQLEQAIAELENVLADPATASNFEKVRKAGEKLERSRARKAEVEDVWMALLAEVEAIKAELGEND
jgi:ATP-binding cassette subfamily F protein 3